MTKIFKLSFIFLIFSTCLFLFSEEVEDVFDFDDLFSNAEDIEAIVEEDEIVKIEENHTKNEKIKTQTFSISGVFTANVGMLAQYPKDPYYFEAGAKISNTLFFLAKASPALSFHASIYTDEKAFTEPKNAFELKTFYFDYLAFDRVLLTAGKKSYNWGNPLYFSSNVLSDFGENISFQLVYPLYPIDILFLGKYNAPITDSMDPKKLDLAFALETSFLGINAKAFSRYWSASKENEIKKIVFGLEWKRDILGLDFYQQALYYFHLPSLSEWNSNSFQLISGLAQIWDGKYKKALVIEHKFHIKLIDNEINQALAFNAGISRLFSGRLKLGLQAEHEFEKKSGKLLFAAILPGSFYGFPHANLEFGLPINYKNNGEIEAKLGFNLAISFAY